VHAGCRRRDARACSYTVCLYSKRLPTGMQRRTDPGRQRPFVFSNLKTGEGLETIVDFIEKQGLMK